MDEYKINEMILSKKELERFYIFKIYDEIIQVVDNNILDYQASIDTIERLEKNISLLRRTRREHFKKIHIDIEYLDEEYKKINDIFLSEKDDTEYSELELIDYVNNEENRKTSDEKYFDKHNEKIINKYGKFMDFYENQNFEKASEEIKKVRI